MGNALFSQWRTSIYDRVVLGLTTKWYEAVLGQLDEGSCVLDVGIGTAGALIRCKDILLERKIRVVGLDYDADYVAGAKAAIEKANLQQQVTVVEMSVYDAPQQRAKLLLPGETKPQPFDAVYFSGSFSLLPDSLGALTAVASLLVPKTQGRIFITQTYQRFVPPLMSLVKPLLLYMISIDFGQLMKEDRMADFFHNEVPKQSNLDCVEHEVIKGSVDNFLQAAYLTILKPRS